MKTITTKNQIAMLTKIKAPKTLPILKMVYAEGGRLEATNLSTTVTIDGISGDAAGFIDAKALKAGGIDGALANWDTLKDTENTAEDWPTLPAADEITAELNQATISAMIEALAATSTDNTRPIITAVQLNGGAITATDDYRLFSKGGGHELDVLIPREVVELVKLAKTLDGWHYGESDNQITLKNGGVTIISRKIDGNYPDWRQLVPAKTDHRIVLEAAKVYEAAKMLQDGAPALHIDQNGAASVQDGTGREIKLHAGETSGEHITNINNVHIVMPLKSDGADTIALNPRYLKDATGKAKYIQIDFSGKFAPTIVHGRAN